jgi:acyl carrier protein
MSINAPLLQEVQEIIVNTLGIEDRAASLSASTPLFGSIPELDSLTVVELAIALETRFGFEVEDSELTAEVFETVGSLADYVRTRRA